MSRKKKLRFHIVDEHSTVDGGSLTSHLTIVFQLNFDNHD